MDDTVYPGASLVDFMNAFNRITKKGSKLRSVRGDKTTLVDKEFNINAHPMFSKTRIVLKATLNKSGKEGANKKRKMYVSLFLVATTRCLDVFFEYDHFLIFSLLGCQVLIITKEMEKAVLVDIDHQVYNPHSC